MDTVGPVEFRQSASLIGLWRMLGSSPPESAYYADEQTGVEITWRAARAINRRIRVNPQHFPGLVTLPRCTSVRLCLRLATR